MAATASSFPPPMPSPGPHSGPFPLTSGSVPNVLPNGLPAMPPEPVVPPPLTSGSGPNGLPNGLPPMPPGPALPPPPNRGGYGLDHRVRNERSGRWTPDEKLLFLHGLKIYGRGRWKKIRHFLPTRSLVQIKSHAQKVLKREQAGDDIFAALKTHKEKLEMLLKNKDHLFHPMINTPSLDANQGYGMIHGKHMPTCPPYYRATVGSPGIAPFTFVPPADQHPNSPGDLGQGTVGAPPPPPHYHPHHHYMMHHHVPPTPPPPHAGPPAPPVVISTSLRSQNLTQQSSQQLSPNKEGKKQTSGNKQSDVLAAAALCDLFRGNQNEDGEKENEAIEAV